MSDWKDDVPSPLDQWRRFNHPYRHQISDIISSYAPANHSILEVGCGLGVNLFWLAQRRPDLTLYGVDINATICDLAKMLVRDGAEIYLGDLLKPCALKEGRFSVLYTVYTCAYLPPRELSIFLGWARHVTDCLILAEPHYPVEHSIACKPSALWYRPYATILQAYGWDVETIDVPNEAEIDHLNAITIAKPSDP